jgi:hypothetical protein
MTAPKAAPKPASPKPAAAPKPTILERQVARHIASCPFGDRGHDIEDEAVCPFSARPTPKLHATAASAEVEAVRHIREAHRADLSLGVVAKRRRQVINETLELA